MAKDHGNSRANANNHANQMNPNNAAYRASRGIPAPATDGGTVAPPALPDPTVTAPVKK